MKKDRKPKLHVIIVRTTPLVTHMLNGFVSDLGYPVKVLDASEIESFLSAHYRSRKLLIMPQSLAVSNLKQFHYVSSRTFFMILKDNGNKFSFDEAFRYRVFGFIQVPIHLAELELSLERLNEYIRMEDQDKN